jgi:hypothetical protein
MIKTTVEPAPKRNNSMLTPETWTSNDTACARQIWAEYQKQHDVSDRKCQAAGIDPVSGRVWFGESDLDVKDQMLAEGLDVPFYCIRVGYDYYLRKGGRR